MSIEQFGWQDVAARERRRRLGWGAVAILIVAAFVLRSGQFGNPIKGLDEQYYLLVGDRMWSGAVPFVDLWDRKPWGLFALFAGIRLLGGDGVIQSQVVATLFAAATACLIAAIAVRSVARTPAVLAGIGYLIALQILWGGAAQTPVFYNLFTVASFWLVLDTAPQLDGRGDRLRVLAAMLLAGLAMQIKYNAAFEGAALGLWLVGRMARAGTPWPRLAGRSFAMIAGALLPTAAVATGYVAAGHWSEFWFANFVSQFGKQGTLNTVAMKRAVTMASLVAPIAALALAGLWRATGRFRHWPSETLLLASWTAFALVDSVAIGGFWAHYALPLAAPALILAAHAFALPRWGKMVFAIYALYPAIDAIVLDRISAGDERAIAAATVAAIPADVATECLFIYEGPVIYYHLTHACLVTRFAFTGHLRSSAEANALGEDAAQALRAALARRPGTILAVDGSVWPERNVTNDAILAATLQRDYFPIARFPHSHLQAGREWLVIWRRRDLGRDLVRRLSKLRPYRPVEITKGKAG